jgi:hypothetical protein
MHHHRMSDLMAEEVVIERVVSEIGGIDREVHGVMQWRI